MTRDGFSSGILEEPRGRFIMLLMIRHALSLIEVVYCNFTFL